NHPSGSLEPSEADIELTRQLLAGAELLAIPILDHLILGNGTHQSIREITTLWDECPQADCFGKWSLQNSCIFPCRVESSRI
ncbi:hypothetical protein CUN59_08005, partial [Cuspidothrix issatschenkoi CHARLIE-1]